MRDMLNQVLEAHPYLKAMSVSILGAGANVFGQTDTSSLPETMRMFADFGIGLGGVAAFVGAIIAAIQFANEWKRKRRK